MLSTKNTQSSFNNKIYSDAITEVTADDFFQVYGH